jgi:hypothetical protein
VSAPNNNNNQQQVKTHPLQIMIKLMLDSQNNITKLIAMQEQQMVYINTMFKNIIDESASTGSTAIPEGQPQPQPQQVNSTAVSTEQQGTIKTTGESVDSQSIPKENKTI